MPRLPKFLRNSLIAVLFLVASPAAYAGYLQLVGNIHTVDPGLVYRSAQLGPEALQRVIDDKHIRSILNLRGSSPSAEWYRNENEVAAENGVGVITIGISADKEPDMATMRQIEAAIKNAPKPRPHPLQGGF